ncbi:hypothetical protein LBWT_10790 [Leptolyngbya boryana IAM M-101]|nr:hypothetical protein LBWT_10790 [Leptolyngbya boryana IAM M-101]BAS61521.1 hypothetical protein LBDG_10790 [Leptolyngbya boryana dg5]
MRDDAHDDENARARDDGNGDRGDDQNDGADFDDENARARDDGNGAAQISASHELS